HVHDALYTIARRLRLGSNDCQFLAGKRVQQRRFPSVRAADDGDESGAHAAKLKAPPVSWEQCGSRECARLASAWIAEFQTSGHRAPQPHLTLECGPAAQLPGLRRL